MRACKLAPINKQRWGDNVMRRPPILHLALVLLGAAAGIPGRTASDRANRASPQSTGTTMPSDIDPKSGFRLPLPNRDDLDEAGKKAYDRGTTPGATIAGLQGPSGIQLYSPKTAASVAALNRYLRFEAGFTAARSRSRDPHHGARNGQPVRMGRARARGAQGRRAARTPSTSSSIGAAPTASTRPMRSSSSSAASSGATTR